MLDAVHLQDFYEGFFSRHLHGALPDFEQKHPFSAVATRGPSVQE
jgi:hypothetical protein